MAFLQTSYPTEMAPGAVGRRVNMEEWNTITRTASEAIGFGQPVERVGDHNCALLDAGGFLGITEADVVLGHESSPDAYAQYDNTAVMTYGVIWVISGGACTVGGPVYWNPATGKYSDTNTGTLIPNAEFDSGVAGADALVKVRLVRVPAAP